MNQLQKTMNRIPIRYLGCCLTSLLLLVTAPSLMADIKIRVSVKFIHNNNTGSTRPGGGIGTVEGFGGEITRGNQVLAATGRGYSLEVVEYLDIQPPAPAMQPADYWFNLPARSNRQTIETAALAATTVWRWNGTGPPSRCDARC